MNGINKIVFTLGSQSYKPLDVISMPKVMALILFLNVVQYNNRGYKIYHFAGGQKIQIRATIPASISIDPVEF